MNERLKKTIKITGIVGICALLFACGCGLGYCSAQKTGEPTKVLTERSRKEAKGTTENGGYDKYTFTITLNRPENTNVFNWYKFDQDYNPTLVTDHTEAGYYFYIEATGTQGTYIKFRLVNNIRNATANIKNFFYLNQGNTIVIDENGGWRTNNVILVSQGASYMIYTPNSAPTTTFEFQDVQSYYLEQGYNTGYGKGYNDGNAEGYEEGFEDGSGTGKMFTYLGVNQMRWYRTNLTATDSTETSVTYRLLTFKDGQNASWSIYAINNISGTELENLKINLYKGTTANSANFRTTLGTGTETTLASGIWDVTPKDYATFPFAQIIDVYNNSLIENYFLMDGIPENATGYQQGYQKGWNDGYNASPGGQSLDNVFSIFTKAFEATASFFNIKVFGFLPIYWFFLIPIFVAIITLLMRMIKH